MNLFLYILRKKLWVEFLEVLTLEVKKKTLQSVYELSHTNRFYNCITNYTSYLKKTWIIENYYFNLNIFFLASKTLVMWNLKVKRIIYIYVNINDIVIIKKSKLLCIENDVFAVDVHVLLVLFFVFKISRQQLCAQSRFLYSKKYERIESSIFFIVQICLDITRIVHDINVKVEILWVRIAACCVIYIWEYSY